MPSDQLWITARRTLGVYFLVSALIALPGILAALGSEPRDTDSRWFLPVVIFCQVVVMTIAGGWLVRGAVGRADSADPAWPLDGLRIVLQVLGVYFAVGGASTLAEWIASVFLMGGGTW